MAKGWIVQVTSEHPGSRGPRLRRQMFDVAIEDKDGALDATRHQTRSGVIVDVIAMAQVTMPTSLSPGRVRARCLPCPVAETASGSDACADRRADDGGDGPARHDGDWDRGRGHAGDAGSHRARRPAPMQPLEPHWLVRRRPASEPLAQTLTRMLGIEA